MEAGADVGDTGRNRVTAEVSHVYFYSAPFLCGKESPLNRHVDASLVSYQLISIQVYCKSFLSDSRLLQNYKKSASLQSETTK